MRLIQVTFSYHGACRSGTEGWSWRHPSGDVYEQGWQNLQYPASRTPLRQTLWGCLLSRWWDIVFHHLNNLHQSKGLFGPREINVFECTVGIKRNGYQVQPGETFMYRWQLREGPSESDPPCISYLYFSSSDPVRDTNSGLIGPLLVCKKDALDSNGAQVK